MKNIREEIATAVEDAGSDHLPLFGGRFEGGYCIQQVPDELARLICLLSAHGPFKSSLEIGVAAGGTTRLIREFVEIENTAIIDDGRHPRFALWADNKQSISNLYEFIGDSHSPEAAGFVACREAAFDLVAIDGDHSAAGVLADWNLVSPYLADGAIVWFHDIHAVREVRNFWVWLKTHDHAGFTTQILLETDRLGIGAIQIWRQN